MGYEQLDILTKVMTPTLMVLGMALAFMAYMQWTRDRRFDREI